QHSSLGFEVETVQRLVIEESSVDFRRTLEQGRRQAAVKCLQVAAERARRLAACSCCRPGLHEIAQNGRAPTWSDRRLKQACVDVVALRGILGSSRHAKDYTRRRSWRRSWSIW